MSANVPEMVYTFGADGHYSLAVSGPDYVVSVPSSLFALDGGTLTTASGITSCDQLGQDAALFGGSCAIVGTDCACTYPTANLNQSGTYSIVGNDKDKLELTGNQGGVLATIDAYCVGGDTLTFFARFGNFPTGARFTKQQ